MTGDVLSHVNSSRPSLTGRIRYLARQIVAKLAYRVHLHAKEREENLLAVGRLKNDLANHRTARYGHVDHYTEDRELAVWERYRGLFQSNTPQQSAVVFRGQYVRGLLNAVLDADPSIKNVVNFGCSYGWLEHKIAAQYPGVRVWGIDRSPRAMRRNAEELSLANCMFLASDIFDFTTSHPEALESAVFCHINVGVYFLPAFLTKLYCSVRDAGASYVVLLEPSGISRQTHSYYRYSFEPQDSVVFRGVMLLNNYPALLRDCDFEITRAELLRPPHPHWDFRSVAFVAKRARSVGSPATEKHKYPTEH